MALQGLRGLGSSAARRSGGLSAYGRTPEEAEASLLAKLGGMATGGLATIGNLLDLPGSMVRDTIGGLATGDWDQHNPFDQWLTPTRDDNRTTGREVLERTFGMRKNRETGIGGWFDDPGEGLRDVAGFGAEVLLDPASYLTFGGSALTKTGKVAQKAGLTPFIREAGKNAGKGIRRARTTLGLDDVLRATGDEARYMNQLRAAIGGKNTPRSSVEMLAGRDPRATLISSQDVLYPEKVDEYLRSGANQVELSPVLNIGGQRFQMVMDGHHRLEAARRAGIDPEFVVPDLGKLGPEQAAFSYPTLNRLMQGKITPEDFIEKMRVDDAYRDVLTGKPVTIPDAAQGARQAEDALQALLKTNEPLGYTVGVGLPFGQPLTGFNLGRPGAFYNRMADKAGMVAGKSAPVRALRSMFDSRVMGRSAAELQEVTPDLFRRQLEAEQAVLSDVLPLADELERKGLATEEAARRQRAYGEGVRGVADPFEAYAVDRVKSRVDEILQGNRRRGFKHDSELDDVIGYMTRHLSRERGTGGRGAGPLSVADPSAVGREDVWKGFKRGTEHLNEVVRDPEIDEFIRTYGGSMPDKKLVQTVRDTIERKYGADIVPEYAARDSSGNVIYQSENQTPKMVDRYEELAKKLIHNPEIREQGLFNNNWLVDAKEYMVSNRRRQEVADTVFDVLSREAKPETTLRLTGSTARRQTIKSVLDKLDLDPKVAAERILERRGQDVTEDAVKSILNESITDELGADLTDLWPAFKAPPEVTSAGKLFDSFTNLFKVGVLTWPARYTRDLLSGQARNLEAGLFDMKSGLDAHRILQGRDVEGLTSIPAIQNFLSRQGINPAQATDQQASHALRQLYGSMKATTTNQMRDVAGAVEPGVRTIDELLGMVPGRKEQTIPGAAMAVGQAAIGRAPGTSLNPLEIRGVMNKAGEIRGETKFGPAVAGDMVGQYTDDMNRLVGFLHQIKKGVDPSVAMEKVNQAQVWYDPRAFTPTERQIKRLFPFYSFSSRQIPWMVQSLMQKPGGRLGTLIKAQAATQRGGAPLPEHLAATGAIPIGTNDDGSQRFITGFGLMHEDPLSFIGGGASGATREILSRLNPIPKTMVEGATGESLFQAGPMGGRDLRDLDPIIGRILVNTGLMDELPGGQAPAVPSQSLEFLLANSPLSRALSTVRTLTDPRKRESVGAFPGDALAMNLLTGVRVSDLSPGAQDAVMRDTASALARESGARTYETVYFSKAQIDETRKIDPRRAEQMEAFNALRNLLGRKAKDRKKSR